MKAVYKKILIVSIIIVVCLFIFWRYRAKSKYIIPTSATSATNDQYDTAFYNTYTGAQATFINTPNIKVTALNSLNVNGTSVTATTLLPHGLAVNSNVVVAGGLGTSLTNYNSNVSIGVPIPNSKISIASSGAGTVNVTTSVPHGLYSGALVNIQGSAPIAGIAAWNGTQAATGNTFDTTLLCSFIPAPTLCISYQNFNASGFTANVAPLPYVSAVPITVTSPTTYTYTWPTSSRGGKPGSNQAVNSNAGYTVPASGIPQTFQVTSVPDTMSFTYTPPALPSGTPNVNAAGYVFNLSDSTVGAAYAVKDGTIQGAVSTWQNNKCPALDPTNTTFCPTQNAQYKTDIATLNSAYLNALGNVNISAARKADTTLVLRKYLSACCPDIYDTASYPGAVTVFPSTATVGTGGTLIDTSRITSANIDTWAKYASPDGITPLVSGSTNWNTSTMQDPVTQKTVAPWQVAKNFGPGYPQTMWT